MSAANYDVIVVGAGPAGISAAIGLARENFSVLVLEAAVFPGAENWSGAIYFTENLAHSDLLGEHGVEDLPYERKISRRGILLSNGHSSFGLSYHSPATFSHSYSVLRPTYDHYLAQVAKRYGASILCETTVTSLIRHRNRVIGVNTERGPFYADLVFLAEGDASHLVSKEGYEKVKKTTSPHFLQGIREVIPLAPEAIERIFKVGAGEGAAFEILLRNGIVNGRSVQLNIGAFLYTNFDSLSLGMVMPLDNLAQYFGGDHNRLMEWFKGMPEVQRLTGGAHSVSCGTKIIRGGGFQEIPRLVDNGLAIGGAASGIGTDFPYPNFTGPATFMGLQIARAAREIRRSGLEFTRDALEKFYVAPLRASHYFKNVEYLRDWPSYMERTIFFFGRNIDAILGSLYTFSRPDFSVGQKFWHCAKVLREAFPLKHWGGIFNDLRVLNRTLKLGRLFRQAIQSLAFRSPNTMPASQGAFDFHYSVEGQEVSLASLPWSFRRFLASPRYRQALGVAADALYRNDDVPLERKLRCGLDSFLRRILFLDVLALFATQVLLKLLIPVQWLCEKMWYLIHRPTVEEFQKTFYQRYLGQCRATINLTDGEVKLAQPWEQKLALNTYFSEKTPYMHILRQKHFETRAHLIGSALWHICPARVYEVHPDDVGQSSVTVNFENCVKCESCWRGSSDVDWSRNRRQRLIYRVYSRANERLFAALNRNSFDPHPPKNVAPWLPGKLGFLASAPSPIAPDQVPRLYAVLEQLCRQLDAYTRTLALSPRALDHNATTRLEQMAFYAAIVGREADEVVRAGLKPNLPGGAEFSDLWSELRQLLARMQIYVHQKKFFWADADASQIRAHHLPTLQRLMPPSVQEGEVPAKSSQFPPMMRKLWEIEDSAVGRVTPRGGTATPAEVSGPTDFRTSVRARIDTAFDKQAIKDLEKGQPLTTAQQTCLRGLCSEVEDTNEVSARRKIILEELGRKDSALAFLVSHHWLASELLGVPLGADRWRSLAFHGTASRKLFVLTALADEFAVIEGDKVHCVDRAAVKVEPTKTLGLTAAKVAQINFPTLPRFHASTLPRDWQAKFTADLVSIALGNGRILLERALSHAQSRVQFPGNFRDEEGEDGIAKFGLVKQMLSEMEADVYLLESLNHFSSTESWRAVALLTGELIGTQPGSLAYNCGQVFGGTAYSEDDVISKFYRDSAVFAFFLERDVELRIAIANDFVAGKFPLAPTTEEMALLEVAARRGALRHPIKGLIEQSKKLGDLKLHHPITSSLQSFVGESSALWWGVKLLLLRTHARLESGQEAAKQVECCRLLARRAEFQMPTVNSADLGHEILAGGYFDQPLAKTIPFSYEELSHREQTYDFGDFLLKPFGSLVARYLPEQLYLDPELAAYNERVRKIFEELSRRTLDGLPYSRYVEKLHAVPDSEIQMLLREGFMRMFIPKELGGEGRPKAEYYILVTHSMRYGEPGIALTIQAHSSIGTTPMLLGLYQDLPRAKKELEEFLADDTLVSHLDREISQILLSLHTPAVLKLKEKFTRLGEFVRTEISKRASLRSIGADFLEAFMKAARAGQRMDLRGFEQNLTKAQAVLPTLKQRAEAGLAELGRREKAHQIFLRYIANGAISAFALTEPSAGSDTASVGTRAYLRRVEVYTDTDGSKYFYLDEKRSQRRRLIEAEKWDLRPSAADVDVAQIRTVAAFAEGGGPPTDATPPRSLTAAKTPAAREFYEFYELNGAKMWITNAHIAGSFALYARTYVGPTGFMLRAPVEGLTVGNDELKMGQRGSPTNELGLSSVRVPRENIIGIEGRGQVNALETLNVGRMGLAVSSMAMMRKIIDQTRAFIQEHGLEKETWVHERVGEMAEELYATESLAFELIGLFDHHGTRSARVESAIGKYFGAEALHRVIRAALSIHGILGQTSEYEIEKHLRDARVLNIYEGTNEVQRFLILRDLVETICPKWKQQAQSPAASGSDPIVGARYGGRLPDAIAKLETAKQHLMIIVDATTKLFGQQVWQNPNFQPTFFLLAELAGLIKLCDSVISRTLWLQAKLADAAAPSDQRHLQLADASARNFLEKTFAETERLFSRFQEDFLGLQKGFYPPQIRVATLGLQQNEPRQETEANRLATIRLDHPMDVLLVLQPVPVLSPKLQIHLASSSRLWRQGDLLEPHFGLSLADRRALDLVLRLKKSSEPSQNLRLTVVIRGPGMFLDHLRGALAAGADDAIWIEEGTAFSAAVDAAHQIAGAIRSRQRTFAFVVTGNEESHLGPALAAQLGLSYVGNVGNFTLNNHSGRDVGLEMYLAEVPDRPILKIFPMCVSVSGAGEPVEVGFHATDYLNSFGKPLDRISAVFPSRPLRFAPAQVASVADETSNASGSPEVAAKLFFQQARLGGVAEAAPKLFEGPISTKLAQEAMNSPAAFFVGVGPVNGELIEIASAVAARCGLSLFVLQFCEADEQQQRRLAGEALLHSIQEVMLLPVAKDLLSDRSVVRTALQKLMSAHHPPVFVMADDEMSEVFAALAMDGDSAFGVKSIMAVNGSIVLVAPIFGGKIDALRELLIPLQRPTWVTFHAGVTADIPRPAKAVHPQVSRASLDLGIAGEPDEIARVWNEARKKTRSGSIRDAEFIIDVGYAIRTREQFDGIVTPLQKLLTELNAPNMMVGGTRKVVEELKLLRSDQQIGQTGSSVNPRIILALGVSGVPQHIDYIGDRATIFAFNKDSEAPIMTLNRRWKTPKVFPIVGDLFETVPRWMAALRELYGKKT